MALDRPVKPDPYSLMPALPSFTLTSEDVTELPAGAGAGSADLPGKAFHVATDFGTKDFGGAAPPAGDQVHRYYFVVHAVGEETLGVDDGVTPAVVSFNLAFKALARAVVVGTYQH